MKLLTWLINKLDKLREKLADREVIRTLKKCNKLSLGCNEADTLLAMRFINR